MDRTMVCVRGEKQRSTTVTENHKWISKNNKGTLKQNPVRSILPCNSSQHWARKSHHGSGDRKAGSNPQPRGWGGGKSPSEPGSVPERGVRALRVELVEHSLADSTGSPCDFTHWCCETRTNFFHQCVPV